MLTPALLQSFFVQQDAAYQKAFGEVTTYWDKFATLMPSSTETTIHSWLAQMPKMREWVGEKVINQLRARAYPLTNKDFENTYKVERNKLDDDLYGIYANHPMQQATVAARWPEDLVTSALIAGITALGYDGQPFFNNSHPVDVDDPSLGTYSNYLPSSPFNAANYQLAKAGMRKFRGEGGVSLQIKPTVTMVGPDDERAAREVLQAQSITQVVKNVAGAENVAAAAPQNVWYGDTLLIVNERLIDDEAGSWYIFSTDRGIAPFVFQQRKPPTRVQMMDPTSPSVFYQKEYLFSVESRGNAGYTLPFLAIKGKA